VEKPELRREFLRVGAVGAVALVWGTPLDADPACEETEDNIEGPFYKAGAPDRETLLEPGTKGAPLVVTGTVMSTDCKPLGGAILDVWQCSADGVYDNSGYTLRGKVHADKNGRYQLRTIQPPPYRVGEGRYRPAHIHLKVSGPGVAVLTTQLYFPGDQYNKTDSAFRQSLVIHPTDGPKGAKIASFDFRLRRA